MKKFIAPLLILALLTACESDRTVIKPATFNDIAGWNQDSLVQPFGMFVESCHAVQSKKRPYQSKEEGPVGVRENWDRACAQAAQLAEPNERAARIFFESNFQPYKIETESQPKGLITGYYEPIINGSKVRKGKFQTPVYGVPTDFHKPYMTREQIVRGDIKGHAPVLLWVDDPVLLFFLHVQGSGKVRLPDGTLTGLQYAGQNGYAYTPIGKILKDRGELTTLSMQTIRDWLLSHPDQMDEVMNQNQSYVFFKHGPGDKVAKGALGLSLTPSRSIAIDDDRAAYGVPTFLDTTQSAYLSGTQIPFQHLMISQDTGGALHSPHRADLFYGQGDVAEWQAGHQNARANVYWLLPVGEPSAVVMPPVMPEAPLPALDAADAEREPVTPPVDAVSAAPVSPVVVTAPVTVAPSPAFTPTVTNVKPVLIKKTATLPGNVPFGPAHAPIVVVPGQ